MQAIETMFRIYVYESKCELFPAEKVDSLEKKVIDKRRILLTINS
jgi:hypothetical protein